MQDRNYASSWIYYLTNRYIYVAKPDLKVHAGQYIT